MELADAEWLRALARPLGLYYWAVAAGNLGAAWHCGRRARRGRATLFGAVGAGFGLFGALAWAELPPGLSAGLKSAINALLSPLSLLCGSFVVLAVLFLGRRFFVRPAVAGLGLNAGLLGLGLSMTDINFAATVLRPDNLPIVAMVFLLGFFVWLGAYQAVENDQRLARDEPPVEKHLSDTVLTWPDLVYIELITMVLLTAVLGVWSLLVRAPLEAPANPVVTPNPSTAPWYFLGLQEMLVFFDPAMAGVIFPALIILGLAAIPYLDVNRRGSGYYTIAQRPLAYVVFQFGFLQLWILLILVGTFLRGPNWSYFGPYEPHDPHKFEALSSLGLSQYFWALWLGAGVPEVTAPAGSLKQLAQILWREIAGVVILLAYFGLLPAVFGRTLLADLRRQMGRTRYAIMVFLLLMMLALPIKMLLRWTCGLSYVVSMPEYSFNF